MEIHWPLSGSIVVFFFWGGGGLKTSSYFRVESILINFIKKNLIEFDIN